MRRFGLEILGIGLAAAALAGCAGGASQYAQTLPEHPAPASLAPPPADEVYLDGTGPTARRMDAPDSPSRPAVARPAGRANSVSSSSSGQEAQKPFTEEWWEKQRREDARLKSRMNICRGC